MKGLTLAAPDARSANRWPRSPLRVEIWRPSPIFALRLTWTLECKFGTKVPHLYKKESITFASLRSACPSLDRRIGAALRLRSKHVDRRRSSHLVMHEEDLLRFRSAQSSGT